MLISRGDKNMKLINIYKIFIIIIIIIISNDIIFDFAGELCHVPFADKSVRPRGAIAHRLTVDARVESGLEIRFVLWLKIILRWKTYLVFDGPGRVRKHKPLFCF